MRFYKSINNLDMVSNGKYNWEVLKETDGSSVYRINVGEYSSTEVLTLLYAKNTLSLRKFSTTYKGGDIFFFECSFDECEKYIDQLSKAHKLSFAPLYIDK